jgi:hypothetical protein
VQAKGTENRAGRGGGVTVTTGTLILGSQGWGMGGTQGKDIGQLPVASRRRQGGTQEGRTQRGMRGGPMHNTTQAGYMTL